MYVYSRGEREEEAVPMFVRTWPPLIKVASCRRGHWVAAKSLEERQTTFRTYAHWLLPPAAMVSVNSDMLSRATWVVGKSVNKT